MGHQMEIVIITFMFLSFAVTVILDVIDRKGGRNRYDAYWEGNKQWIAWQEEDKEKKD